MPSTLTAYSLSFRVTVATCSLPALIDRLRSSCGSGSGQMADSLIESFDASPRTSAAQTDCPAGRPAARGRYHRRSPRYEGSNCAFAGPSSIDLCLWASLLPVAQPIGGALLEHGRPIRSHEVLKNPGLARLLCPVNSQFSIARFVLSSILALFVLPRSEEHTSELQ